MTKLTLAVLMAALVGACSGEDAQKQGAQSQGEHAHAHEGPHGGHLLEVGNHLAHLEVIHDEAAGKRTASVSFIRSRP